MELKTTNPNYCATIIKIDNLITLAGCDNVVGVSVFGYQAIVSKDTKPGDLGILFTAETQLSEDFCRENNLFRDAEKNADKTQKGYIENHRRIKAVKFRGHASSALIMPLSSVYYINHLPKVLNVGDTFNEINSVEVCKKFELPLKGASLQKEKQTKESLVDKKLFPEHMDTENYFRNSHLLLGTDEVFITQKLHGTSGRFGYVRVKKELSWKDKIAKRFGIDIEETKYDYVAGSRKVIKYSKGKSDGGGFYNSDVWNTTLEKYKTKIPKDYIIYGEIIGWIGESPIQKGYTYHLPKGENELYVYRVVVMNADGIGIDLTQLQLMEFCKKNGFLFCPVIVNCEYETVIGIEGCEPNEFSIESFMDIKLNEKHPQCLPLSKDSPCDEGVIIRRDGLTPLLLKAKCQTFLQHESKVLDSGEDITS